MTEKLLLLNLAALSPHEISEATTPNLAQLAADGQLSGMKESFPALTCTSHATMLTGVEPAVHGIVGNGWYDRSHAKVFMWNRSAHHIQAPSLLDTMRERAPGAGTASAFWRFAADSTADQMVTERPVYWSSGRKTFDFFTTPPSMHDRLMSNLGKFPFPQFWGPFAGIKSSVWIIECLRQIMREDDPALLVGYAPYLDYEAQRYGPESAQAKEALGNMDSALGALLDDARAAGRHVAIVSDYGFTTVTRPIMPNRILREAGFLAIEEAANGDQIDAGSSRALAVCDNQIAHVYVANIGDLDAVRGVLLAAPGIRQVLGAEEKRAAGMDHARSGELIAVAERDAWFAYPYWTRPERAPDYERCIAIFDKGGFDPCELFAPPGPFGKPWIAMRVAQKMAGLAVPFDVIDPDPSRPRGARLVGAGPTEGATLITSWEHGNGDCIAMTALKSLLETRLGI
jgi:predicted AlkP superfamily pyrophosphatase or phosphodiesterase